MKFRSFIRSLMLMATGALMATLTILSTQTASAGGPSQDIFPLAFTYGGYTTRLTLAKSRDTSNIFSGIWARASDGRGEEELMITPACPADQHTMMVMLPGSSESNWTPEIAGVSWTFSAENPTGIKVTIGRFFDTSTNTDLNREPDADPDKPNITTTRGRWDCFLPRAVTGPRI